MNAPSRKGFPPGIPSTAEMAQSRANAEAERMQDIIRGARQFGPDVSFEIEPVAPGWIVASMIQPTETEGGVSIPDSAQKQFVYFRALKVGPALMQFGHPMARTITEEGQEFLALQQNAIAHIYRGLSVWFVQQSGVLGGIKHKSPDPMTAHEKGRLRYFLTEVAEQLGDDDVTGAIATIRECSDEFDLESEDDEEIEAEEV